MKRRKSNISLWYAMGLALLLLGGTLAASTGTAYARYRAESTIVVPFSVRAPEPVYLGAWEMLEDGVTPVFTQKNVTGWETAGDMSSLHFVAANGAAADTFLAEDQQIRVRLVGSIGLLNNTSAAAPVITLSVPKTVPSKSEDPEEAAGDAEDTAGTEEQYDTYTAVATEIAADSALGKSFGQGWVFTFHETEMVKDENGKTAAIQGEELSWTLKGGQFSTLDMKLTLENGVLSETSILNLQVIGE